jgi:trans-aconitate 2-methyltransferase
LGAETETIVTKPPAKYSWNAQDYAKHSSAQQECARELIPKLKLSGTEAVLDIGCGDGKITAQIASVLPRGCVVGIDNSEDMIDLARRSFPPSAYPNLTFRKMSAQSLSFQDEFDRVLSNAALHWIIDHRSVLKGVWRSLKAGGRMLFQMGGKGNGHDVFAVLDELLLEDRWRKFFVGFAFPYGFYAPETYAVWLREAGLKPERVELLQKDMKLSGRDGLAGWIRTTWLPYTQRLPEELRNEFVSEIVDRYVEKHPLDNAGYVHVGMIRLEVEATK